MADARFAIFYSSRDPSLKMETLDLMNGFLQRNFTLSTPVYSSLIMSNYKFVLASMNLKMGNATEFHRIIESIIDVCLAALTDKVGWNDGRALLDLDRAAAILAKATPKTQMSQKLFRYARIAVSAMFSRTGPRVDDEITERLAEATSERLRTLVEAESSGYASERQQPQDEGDLLDPVIGTYICDGSCIPRARWSWWGKDRAYYCLTCSVTLLCPRCYENVRLTASGAASHPSRSYCGTFHEYLALPIEGWQGIKDGKLMIEGETPMPMGDFFNSLRLNVDQAWDEFWSDA